MTEDESGFVVIVDGRGMDALAIGPFSDRESAQAEASRWRAPYIRAMVRNLWNGDDLRRLTSAPAPEAKP